MANGKIRFGKQSGGELALVFPDGVDNTEVTFPESGVLATKQYVDAADYLQPSLTANATLTGSNNKIVMNGIVASLGLEIGDVIKFTSVANANNQKLRTVESIINDNEIIVNYEHCGSRGDGILKLTDETLTNATIKRIAKWYNAPLGLGQDWVLLNSQRAISTNYTNSTNRLTKIVVTSGRNDGSSHSVSITCNGRLLAISSNANYTGSSTNTWGSGEIPANGIYQFTLYNYITSSVSELR